MSGSQTVWLYAVTRADGCGTAPSPPGVSGEHVRAVVDGPLAAVVGSVDAQQFGPEALARNLENLDWLAAKARIHDAIVAAVAACGPVVPVRLATLFSSDEGVRQLLRDRRDDFQRALRAVTGRAEWGVKAYVDPDSLAGSLSGQPDLHQPSGEGDLAHRGQGAGSAYLLRRRDQLAARASAQSTAAAR